MDELKNGKIKHFTIKRYNTHNYKLTLHKTAFILPEYKYKFDRIVNRNINAEKLDNNISRAKSKIFEYALCNDFDYFVTFTLSKDKRDRYNRAAFIKDLSQDIRDCRKHYSLDIQYLLIPEPHKDGAWHMHGLIKGIPLEQLLLFTLEDKIPNRLREMIKKGHIIYNWPRYAEKFGFNTFEVVKSQVAVSKYITKYISKSLKADLSTEKEKKLYYPSRGLKTAQNVYHGLFNPEIELTMDFENDYVKTKMLNGIEYLRVIDHLDKVYQK